MVGIFVQKIHDFADWDMDMALGDALSKIRSKEKALGALFDEFPKTDEWASLREVKEAFKSPRIQGYFGLLGIDFTTDKSFFRWLDVDCNRQVTREEFIAGCMRLQGGAKSAEVL